jgi:hypothetical protein
MKNLMKFIAKAFFGGCIGCLGAWFMTATIILVLVLVFNATIGPGLIDSVKGFFQDLPNTLFSSLTNSFLPSDEGNAPAIDVPSSLGLSSLYCPPGEPPVLQLFMTEGNDPISEHVTQITSEQSATARFWVKAPEGVTVNFALILTHPDGTTSMFGPESDPVFTSDPGGWPYTVGGLGSAAPIGSYNLSIYVCQHVSVASLQFEVVP